MAVHFAAGVGNYAQRTAGGFLNPVGVSTVMVWVKFGTVQALPNYNLAYALLDDPAVYAEFVTIDGATTTNNLELEMTGVSNLSTDDTPVVGQWYHVCWTQNNNTQTFYVNGTQIGTNIVNRTAWTIGFEMIGNDTFATGDISLQYFRSWQLLLTTEQIRTEMQSTTAVVGSSYMNTPLTSDLLDISGHGRDWTLVGADSFVAGPSFPANSTPATATALSGLPTSVTTDFLDGMYGWYTYQSVPADLVVSFWAFSNLTDTLTVQTSYGTSSSMTNFTQAVNVPFELPTKGGDTFFWRVFSSPGQPTDDVVVTGTLKPDLTVPVGALGVNDDGNGDVNGVTLPAAFLSSTTAETLAFADAAAGETGMVFPPTGQVCLYDALTGEVRIYPSDLGTATTTIEESTIHSGGPVKVINSDQTTQFYVGGFQSGTTCHAFTLSPSGTIGATDYPITITVATSLKCLAPNQDNTVLYYGDTGTATALRRWDLVNNIALSNLAAGVANHQNNEDLLVLADGTILAAYIKATATTDYFVRRYSAAGAILNTYSSFGATNRIHRMAHSIDDPDAFWVWLYLDDDPGTDFGGGISRFVQVDVATGTFLSSVEAANFEVGVYNAEPVADPILFGHSFSCPFWINRVSMAPTPTPGERSTEYLIRRERWFPVISQEQRRMFFHALQLYFEAGTGITTGQGSNPIVELDWSDDGGHTWNNLHLLETGPKGQYTRRAIQRMMGSSRERIYRVAVTDPVQWSLIDAFLTMTMGTS